MLRATKRFLSLGLLVLVVASTAGCRQDMHDQAKLEPLEASNFFADGRASRPVPAGTVARGLLGADKLVTTGRNAAGFANEIPVPVDLDFVAWGRTRYDIFCSPCHDRAGEGRGMIVERGYKQPPSLHDARLVAASPGYVFNAITKGFGVMPSHAMQVPVRDRWAIVAYVKALQLTRTARFESLNRSEQLELEASGD
ncbi:MAG: hypothetical protein ACI91F_000519 [Candidatus Binatia bacterium]